MTNTVKLNQIIKKNKAGKLWEEEDALKIRDRQHI